MTKIAGSGYGSVSQRYGSEDPDPFQNVMDPQHWSPPSTSLFAGQEREGLPVGLERGDLLHQRGGQGQAAALQEERVPSAARQGINNPLLLPPVLSSIQT
jgi:hypothetical protein